MVFGILSLAWLVSSSGCSVSGFRAVPDGLTTPSQLRSAAAVARAESIALEELANEQQGVWDQFRETGKQVVGELGLPGLATGLLGVGLGWVGLPTPGQTRRVRDAERIGKAEAKSA